MHCGNVKYLSLFFNLIINFFLLFLECSRCNNFLSGNLAVYTWALELKIGKDRLIALDVEGEPQKYTAEDYAAITKTYQQKIKVLKNERSMQ